MESFETCEHCKEFFNLTTHKPIIFQECLDTVCFKCVQDDNQYQCCINQNHNIAIDPNNLDQLKINPTIKRKLEAQTSVPIFCEIHKNQTAQFLIQNSNKIVCSSCILLIELKEPEQGNLRKINKNGLKRYAGKSIEYLEQGILQLQNLKQKLVQVQNDELNFTNQDLTNIAVIKLLENIIQTFNNQITGKQNSISTLMNYFYLIINGQIKFQLQQVEIFFFLLPKIKKQIIKKRVNFLAQKDLVLNPNEIFKQIYFR